MGCPYPVCSDGSSKCCLDKLKHEVNLSVSETASSPPFTPVLDLHALGSLSLYLLCNPSAHF